mmetsp:Transcript_12766/g.18778  ORF Transcript_12766/g.18778 Transcript_12766/m.18778 type:complete len:179 (-) Transcript_12766:73-609(-)
MRVSQIAFAVAMLSNASAFTIAPRPASFALSMSDAVAEPEVAEEAAEEAAPAPAPAAPKSGLTISGVRISIDSLTSDNFSSTLSEIEPFLVNEAGVTFYKKSMRRITRAAKATGATLPEGYALEAKATAARRIKQNEFIQQKEAERVEAEAAAADAAKEEAPAEEESAPAEEEAAPAE